MRVAIVGVTGMVGRELLLGLQKRNFPVSALNLFSSGKTRESLVFNKKKLRVSRPSFSQLTKSDLIFFASSDEVSKRWAKRLSARGIWVIDDSSAFRDDPRVPLIIPEVNAKILSSDSRLIAGPNCTMVGLAVAGRLLQNKIGILEIRLASYQSVSGAGKQALDEFFRSARIDAQRLSTQDGRAPLIQSRPAQFLPASIFLNVIPQVGFFDSGGHSLEENKVAAELRKVWNSPTLSISSSAVRVPTIRGHCLAVWIKLKRAISLNEARKLVSKAATLSKNDYPTPLSCAGKEGVFVARLRRGCTPDEISLWIVSDNLLKGAAQNSIQIAEELLNRGWLK